MEGKLDKLDETEKSQPKAMKLETFTQRFCETKSMSY